MGLSRLGLLRALGVVKPDLPTTGLVELTQGIYDRQALEAYERVSDDAPHGAPWHTSFHASRFPGTDGCARQHVYSLLNVPDKEPTPGWLVAVSDAGKDIEMQIVRRWYEEGILLTAPPHAEYQTNFVHPEHWLTCSVDAALDRRADGIPWPQAVDVKGKDHRIIDDLQNGTREPDPGHVKQMMVQIWSLRENMEMIPKLTFPPQAGSLLYVSRQRPLHQHEAYIDFDQAVIDAGLETLARAKSAFLEGTLPKRPKEWRWTKPPCQWCPVKRECKEDVRHDIDRIEESHTLKRAKELDPTYDHAAVRRAVLSRWREGGESWHRSKRPRQRTPTSPTGR